MRSSWILASSLCFGGLSPVASLPEAVKDILACPIKFIKCVTNKDCRESLTCAGDCMIGKAMNLTCFVPCVFGYDQKLMNDFTTCTYNKKPKSNESFVIDAPMGGMCITPTGLVNTAFELKQLTGLWYLVAGASSLETFDCQVNRFTQINGTTWRVDEYYQGNITGIGFKWAQGSQDVHQAAPGITKWHMVDGTSGYESTYYALAASEDYVVSLYCAPLEPTEFGWTSLVAYSRKPELSGEAEAEMLKLMQHLKWDQPLVKVNHEGCVYRLPNPPTPVSAGVKEEL